MKRTITHPNKANHKLYIFLIIVFLITLVLSFYIPPESDGAQFPLSEIIKNLSYCCIASTFVAWIIDYANTRHLNRKAHSIYDAVYGDLKFHIGAYIETWAELCAVSFKDKDYYSEKHTWDAWYTIVKENYHKCKPERQQHLLDFFYQQLLYAETEVNKSLEYLQSQRYMLTMNDVMNSEIDSILSDFRFEFYALDLDLSRRDTPEMFWAHMDAITSDLTRYINNWKDIRYYNFLIFRPYKFFENTKELMSAVLVSGCAELNRSRLRPIFRKIKHMILR